MPDTAKIKSEGVTDKSLVRIAASPKKRSRARKTPVEEMVRSAPIERSSLTERVREEILRRILDGDIQPGDRIIEMRVAQELGTSQAPVREALRSLEVLGVIESTRNRGARVRMLDGRELAEITDVRAELEGYAAAIASDRLKGNTAELEKHVRTMRQAARAKDMRRFAEANTRFHRSIVEATGNGTLLDIWTKLDVKAHTIMNVLRGHRDLASVAESHWPVVAALKTGDGRAAREAIRKHILELKLVVP
jgi:DNA-binding GntR family transcriptional regulator